VRFGRKRNDRRNYRGYKSHKNKRLRRIGLGVLLFCILITALIIIPRVLDYLTPKEQIPTMEKERMQYELRHMGDFSKSVLNGVLTYEIMVIAIVVIVIMGIIWLVKG